MFEHSIVDGVRIFAAPTGREYAAVEQAGGGRTVCTAHGVGGHIDVTCDAPQDGVLTVKENSWSGWQAEVDGRPLQLRPGRFLAVDLPAGVQIVRFRYRPWDVPLGVGLCLIGVVLALFFARKRDVGAF